jgi:transglutaminase-like putative cysteine protease
MCKKICFSIFILLSLTVLSASDLKYPVSEIPSALKENAHSVFRLYQQEVEIKSEKSAIVTVTEVRTILNKNGETNAYFMELSNPMNKIFNIKGKVYDGMGKQIRSFGADDVIDQSGISGYSMYEDNRIKIIEPKYLTYPFTVEYSYQVEQKQTFELPSWSHGSENTSYENSSFVVKVPEGYAFRYKEYNLAKRVVKTSQDGKDIYTWTLSNLKARIEEPMSSITKPDYPLVELAPNKFEVGDSKGSCENWKEIGKWSTTLIEGKDKLPEATIAKIKEITSNCKTDFEKVKKVYEYMQLKTRYVSVQIGIGGWKPFDATVVDKYSYGDCKALSNYTKALLNSIGIKSLYTLVYAGSESNNIDESFPSNQFNHAIICVPLEKDTVWLECTSQRLPGGYNSDFTDDRQVLLVDGENSRLVHTRIYPASENCIYRYSRVNLNNEASGLAEVKAVYKGLCYDNILPIFYADNADKKKLATQRIELPSFTLDKFSYTENRDRTPSFDENLNITVTNYIHNLVNDIALLPLNFMNKLTSIPEKVRNRKTDLCIRRSSMESDTVLYQLPKDYTVTALPEKSEITTKFGKYSAMATLQGSSITYIRHFELFKGVFPPEAYSEFRDFLEQISTADEAVASLKKQKDIGGIQ